jgi:SpoVK/Ycf46/Vps4 family AAA+-type ATPase
MPTTRKLAELFRAIAAEDITTAATIASQVCQIEERKGHRTAARTLRGALHANGSGSDPGAPHGGLPNNPIAVISTALVRLSGDKALADVVLNATVRRELENVILEWKHRVRLSERGVFPRSKLLFHGPPGCGKSLTAQALGRELGIPVYLVRFDAIIGAYLGQTAIHLRQLFHFAETTPCVLLLDELDALGKKRGNPLDVGELDRIVIALMQELEHSTPLGMIIGTSNLPQHLDEALWRRFDLDVSFAAPTKKALRAFLNCFTSRHRVKLPATVVRQAAGSRSFAAAESIILGELRRQTLAEVKD